MKTIAVLGASANRQKFGNKCVRAYRDAGYRVFPVNPGEREIEGLPVCRTLAEVPAPIDRISVYLPPALTLSLLPAIARAAGAPGGPGGAGAGADAGSSTGAAGARLAGTTAGHPAATEVWFNPGSADGAVLAEARRLGIAARPGCSIVDIGKRPGEYPG
ncbi:MAG TPA: CoA-binding protein [Thermoanaerobaculia bacterium]|nr:CoA-binding protein [Thermoanaerobaculia bacterium]